MKELLLQRSTFSAKVRAVRLGDHAEERVEIGANDLLVMGKVHLHTAAGKDFPPEVKMQTFRIHEDAVHIK